MRSNGTGFHHSLHQTSLVRRTRSLELQMGCSTDFVIVPVCFQMSANVVGTTVKIRASKRDRSIKTATFVILYTNNVDRVVWTMKPRIHAWLNLAQATWLTSQCCWICATLCLICTCTYTWTASSAYWIAEFCSILWCVIINPGDLNSIDVCVADIKPVSFVVPHRYCKYCMWHPHLQLRRQQPIRKQADTPPRQGATQVDMLLLCSGPLL